MDRQPESDTPTADTQRDDHEGTVEPPGTQVFHELASQCDGFEDGTDKRAHQRRSWAVPIRLELIDPSSPDPRAVRAVTHDISAGGFSFIVESFVHVETEVRVRFDSLPDRPLLHGVVRYCLYVSGGHYRVGVRFTSVARRGM